MSEAQWFKDMMQREGVLVPDNLERILNGVETDIARFVLLDTEASIRQFEAIFPQLPEVVVVIFARRRNDDVAIGIVLEGPRYERGQVLSIFDDVTTPPIVEDVYPSLEAWADAAWDDINRREVSTP